MKNLLPIVLGVALVTSACGSTEEEKKVEQVRAEKKIDEKVNEIMNELEAAGHESGVATDTVSAQDYHHSREGQNHDGHDHTEHGH